MKKNDKSSEVGSSIIFILRSHCIFISGLTQIALQGLRKQSVPDAELLLSHRVADFMSENNRHPREAEYVRVIAAFHESWDGRGLSQEQRRQANVNLLNYILDEWMPWHQTTRDFRLIDVNKYVQCTLYTSKSNFIGRHTYFIVQNLILLYM